MIWKNSLIALVVFAGAFVAAAPTAAGYNECNILGARDLTGEYIAPPCVDTRAESGPIRTAQDSACAVNPGAELPSPVSRGSCSRYYILLSTDYDGLGPGNAQDERLIWEETNGCDGLQRTRSLGCVSADRPLQGFSLI